MAPGRLPPLRTARGLWSCGRWTWSGGFHLADRTELKAVTGLDDHSRYCVSAHLVLRATSRPTCRALKGAMDKHGVPEAVMTDNAKTFTARFGPGPGPV